LLIAVIATIVIVVVLLIVVIQLKILKTLGREVEDGRLFTLAMPIGRRDGNVLMQHFLARKLKIVRMALSSKSTLGEVVERQAARLMQGGGITRVRIQRWGIVGQIGCGTLFIAMTIRVLRTL
jgi:hypothetical protein